MEGVGQVQRVLEMAGLELVWILSMRVPEYWVYLQSPFDVVRKSSLLKLVMEPKELVSPFFQVASWLPSNQGASGGLLQCVKQSWISQF